MNSHDKYTSTDGSTFEVTGLIGLIPIRFDMDLAEIVEVLHTIGIDTIIRESEPVFLPEGTKLLSGSYEHSSWQVRASMLSSPTELTTADTGLLIEFHPDSHCNSITVDVDWERNSSVEFMGGSFFQGTVCETVRRVHAEVGPPIVYDDGYTHYFFPPIGLTISEEDDDPDWHCFRLTDQEEAILDLELALDYLIR